jgi:IclR family transcriptional regulator, pca regulon regulatory protein
MSNIHSAMDNGPKPSRSRRAIVRRQAALADKAKVPRGEFVKSLERGLAVIQVFGADRSKLSLTEVAKLTDMTRAAARRYLLSLRAMGYVGSDGKLFWLEPRVLNLGYSYLSSVNWIDFAQPILREVTDRLNESCSASVLDGLEIVYVARSQASRIMSINLGIGTRLPAVVTSMGRVLLAALSPDALERALKTVSLHSYTDKTVTSLREIKAILETARENKYAYVDQELESGLRSIAVPILGSEGQTIAALNVSAQAIRVKKSEMTGRYLDTLREAAGKISMLSRTIP